ncbi:MAG: diguanylate cyclase [Phreatobacter sp.]|uniref:diguanylate cyclase n=1 Tax=Phreatobacter sp. TaxID=1966341 RepID=UPI004036C95D
MSGIILLLTQSLLYFGVMAVLFRMRHAMGLGAFLCALGVMHFLETYLAAVFFIQLPFGLLSPGSTVLFSGKLAIILLFYIREDAETVRQPIYGLLIGNFLMVGLVATLRLYGPPVSLQGYNPDLALINQMGVLMVWGTTLLFIDAIALILVYERLRSLLPRSVVLRAGVSLAVILSFDQVAFFVGLHWVTGTPIDALYGGWIAKMGAALVYAVYIGIYLSLFERQKAETPPEPLGDVFHKLTYRHKYEELLGTTSRDALTGALTRERFEAMAGPMLAVAIAEGRPCSLLMVDADHFKSINDHHGHVAGDAVLRRIVETMRGQIRSKDAVFRYGGEEFIVLAPDMGEAAALAAAERIRSAVEAGLDDVGDPVPTVSIGIAVAPGEGTSIAALLRLADSRLYEAKRLGRNRVVARPADIST